MASDEETDEDEKWVFKTSVSAHVNSRRGIFDISLENERNCLSKEQDSKNYRSNPGDRPGSPDSETAPVYQI